MRSTFYIEILDLQKKILLKKVPISFVRWINNDDHNNYRIENLTANRFSLNSYTI